jgi:site-specific DNA recombinase
VHQILTREAYAGRAYFNRTDSRTRQVKDRREWIEMETPVIVDPAIFGAVQRKLESRRPSRTPPRVVNGPTLLTGIARCATCGGGMTIRTGKGGRYRYYTCNNRVNEGATTCKGRSMPMARLDGLVIDQLEKRVFAPERLEKILAALAQRSRHSADAQALEAKELRKQLRATEEKIQRLYDAVAEGTVADTDLLRRSLSRFDQERDEHLRLIASLDRRRDIPRHVLSPGSLRRFAAAAAERLRADDPAFRKAYVRQFIDRIEVDDAEIRIHGPKSALAAGLVHPESPKAQGVPSFEREWWARQDSNLQPDRYERPALTS